MKRLATLSAVVLLTGCGILTGPHYDCTHERRRTFWAPVTLVALDSTGVFHVSQSYRQVTWVDTICVDR